MEKSKMEDFPVLNKLITICAKKTKTRIELMKNKENWRNPKESDKKDTRKERKQASP